jgi:ABC-type sugar transport system substrate-binding protein
MSRFRPAGFRNGRTAWRRTSRPDSGRPELLKAGYVATLVGQRPFEMREKSMDTLLALHDGKPVQEIIYTGVDRVTKDNVGEFLK